MKKQLLTTTIMLSMVGTCLANNPLTIGNGVINNHTNSIGIGNGVINNFSNSISVGNGVVTNFNSVGIGNGVTSNVQDSINIGNGVTSNGESSVAIGNGISAEGVKTVNIGTNVTATGTSSIVIGRDTTVNGDDTTVIGANNGTVASSQSAIYGYNNVVQGSEKEQLVFGVNSTTKEQGATVVGSHSQAVAVDSLALGNNAVADVQNSVALGTNSTTEEAISTDHIFINGERYDFAGGVANSTVSVGATNKAGYSGVSDYKRTITNVGAGRVDSTSTDAINGSQLNAVINALKFTTVVSGDNTTVKQSTNIDGGKEFSVSVNKDLTNMNSVEVGTVNDTQRNFMTKEGNHVFNNEVNTLYSANGMKLENTDNLDTASVDLNGLVADSNNNHVEFTTNNVSVGNQQIHDVQAGVKDTDAVNVSQLKQTQLGVSNQVSQMNTQINAQMNQMNNNINQVNTRMNRLGASSASLAGLHPLDFNRNDKASYAISYGHYRNANAVAIGAFYRPNERVMIGAGMSLGAENQYTLNVAFKTGKGSDYVAEAKTAQSRISSLESLVAKLTQEVAELKNK